MPRRILRPHARRADTGSGPQRWLDALRRADAPRPADNTHPPVPIAHHAPGIRRNPGGGRPANRRRERDRQPGERVGCGNRRRNAAAVAADITEPTSSEARPLEAMRPRTVARWTAPTVPVPPRNRLRTRSTVHPVSVLTLGDDERPELRNRRQPGSRSARRSFPNAGAKLVASCAFLHRVQFDFGRAKRRDLWRRAAASHEDPPHTTHHRSALLLRRKRAKSFRRQPSNLGRLCQRKRPKSGGESRGSPLTHNARKVAPGPKRNRQSD